MLNKTDLLIKEKRAELDILELEMYEALRYPKDIDYEYAALLYPLIGGTKQEILKLESLALYPDLPCGKGFEAQVWQLLTGQYKSLEIWIDIQNHFLPQTTCLLEMRTMKTRNTLSCTIRYGKFMERYLGDNTPALLEQIGWHKMLSGKLFRRKALVRNLNDLEALCHFISVTMLESLYEIWQYSKGQYYLFRK